jgi:hypothetical protein
MVKRKELEEREEASYQAFLEGLSLKELLALLKNEHGVENLKEYLGMELGSQIYQLMRIAERLED